MQLRLGLRIFFIILGIIAVYILTREYSITKVADTPQVAHSGVVTGPLLGRVKYMDIISKPIPDCINYGFMVFLKGIGNEDFIVLTDSIRASFGDLSGNIVGKSFKFERLISCKERFENSKAYLLMSPPILLEDEAGDRGDIK